MPAVDYSWALLLSYQTIRRQNTKTVASNFFNFPKIFSSYWQNGVTQNTQSTNETQKWTAQLFPLHETLRKSVDIAPLILNLRTWRNVHRQATAALPPREDPPASYPIG
jgi:hypothetical protein